MNIAIKSMALILAILLTRETVTNDGGVVKEGWMVAPYLGQKKWEF